MLLCIVAALGFAAGWQACQLQQELNEAEEREEKLHRSQLLQLN